MRSTFRPHLRCYMQSNSEEISMNRALLVSVTVTGLLVFCLNASALDLDLKHRNNHKNLYYHSHPDSVFNYVDRKAKRVIRTDYRKVRERVKADTIGRHRYAEHHHRGAQHHLVFHSHHRYSKAHLDSLIAMYLVDRIYHGNH